MNNTLGIGSVGNEKQGEVKKWFEEKGYGFIKTEEKDYFVHITQVEDKKPLIIGSRVSFCVQTNIKGEHAVDVKTI